MKRINNIAALIILFGLSSHLSFSQSQELNGKIKANANVENIHVLNLSAKKYTISDLKGEFSIEAETDDTLLISGVQYIPKTLIVSKAMYTNQYLTVNLEDRVNQLDEVIVGKVLTGDLISDIENSDVKRDINFYDVGIPGYTGKPKTQKERKLFEADAGKSIIIAPMFIGINVHKILNRISGRTKKLKKAVLMEQQVVCMNKVKSEFSDLLFSEYNIEERLKIAFFYYVAEDPNFKSICDNYNSFNTYNFLLNKLYLYNETDPIETD